MVKDIYEVFQKYISKADYTTFSSATVQRASQTILDIQSTMAERQAMVPLERLQVFVERSQALFAAMKLFVDNESYFSTIWVGSLTVVLIWNTILQIQG